MKETKNQSMAEFIETEPGIKLHVSDYGKGKVVVLIHGWPLSDEMYEYQYNVLRKKGFRVIGITLRGFGKSSQIAGTYNYDVFADDIKKVLDQLEIKDATLVGFSMGGAISIHYISRHKCAGISKLVLLGAAAPRWTKNEDYPYGFSKEEVNGLIALLNTNRPQLIDNFGKIFCATEDALPAGIAAWLRSINMQASPYALEECLEALRDSDLRDELADVKIPTAIFHGRKDKICSFEFAGEMKKGIKDSIIVPFEKSGHGLFYEERDKVNEELIKFIG
ncbi:MAG: alpha/beta hydrolase [Bacteroidota bacterium]|nr:alpha/beta hydrolase [Bacteroidota bacterium]